MTPITTARTTGRSKKAPTARTDHTVICSASEVGSPSGVRDWREAHASGTITRRPRSELRTLAGLLDESPLGLARLGLVLGEPGIGKTRLVSEFARAGREAGLDVVTMQAQPATSAVNAGTLLPLLPTAPPTGDDAAVLWWARNTLARSHHDSPW